MTGRRPMYTKQAGRMSWKCNSLIIVICLLLVFSGCSASQWIGEFGSDWSNDLIAGYTIVRVKSHQIVIAYNNDNGIREFVISNYYITGYQIYEDSICLEGIPTQQRFASEKELETRILCYYLIDTNTKKVAGPFDSMDSFSSHCESVGIDLSNQWTKPNE